MFNLHTLKQCRLQSRARMKKPNAGMTLIELMVAIVIMAILSMLAVPSFQKQIAASRLTSATNDLFTSLTQARADSIRQGVRMTVCVSSNGSSCDAVSTTATWSVGWVGFNDPTRAASPALDSGETTTFVVQEIHPSIVVRGTGTTSNYVSFSPDGLAKTLSGGMGNGTIRVCSNSSALPDDERARHIVINRSGRLVIEKPATSVTDACAAPS
jgi:type IV fimbrial biogenesis protein FimT